MNPLIQLIRYSGEIEIETCAIKTLQACWISVMLSPLSKIRPVFIELEF